MKAVDKRVYICDQFRCFQPGEFQPAAMAGLAGRSKAFFESLRQAAASDTSRVQYLAKEISFFYTHDLHDKIEYSSRGDAVDKVCQNFDVDKKALGKLLSSEGNSKKLEAVSKQDGKTYVIAKGYRPGTLAIYESNGKVPSSEYLNEKLNAINDSTCLITSKYVELLAQTSRSPVSSVVFSKGVAEISLGAEQLTLDMGGVIYETLSSMAENKHVAWARPGAKPDLAMTTALKAADAYMTDRAVTINVKKEYDDNAGKGAFDNFANQTASPLYGVYLKISQSAMPAGGTSNAFMNAVAANVQARDTARDMQATSEFTYGIAKKKKEEKDDQDGKTGSGFS